MEEYAEETLEGKVDFWTVKEIRESINKEIL